MANALNIVDTAYRATLEEQDDTALWFIHAIRKNGAESDILLTGNAVNYAVVGQNPKPLNFGSGSIPYPNKFDQDLQALIKSGAKVFYLSDDAVERGIKPDQLIKEAEGISRAGLAKFVDQYNHLWHW
jgi:hypothetical protein